MATDWSDDIAIADLADEPALSEELSQLIERVGQQQFGIKAGRVADRAQHAGAFAEQLVGARTGRRAGLGTAFCGHAAYVSLPFAQEISRCQPNHLQESPGPVMHRPDSWLPAAFMVEQPPMPRPVR